MDSAPSDRTTSTRDADATPKGRAFEGDDRVDSVSRLTAIETMLTAGFRQSPVHVPIVKADDDERFVLGIVLEPETRDAQGDVVSAAEIRQAAHRFLESYGVRGLQHKFDVGDRAAIVESYLAPHAFQLDGFTVKAGTWLLAWKVRDDDLWSSIKSGELTGFSIGGSALRVPDRG